MATPRPHCPRTADGFLMLDILAITGPIYITIALGFLTTRMGLFSPADMRVMGKFVINLALPALLFHALAQRPLGEILNAPYLLVYTLGSLITIAVGWLWARRVAGQDGTTSAYYAMGMWCSPPPCPCWASTSSWRKSTATTAWPPPRCWVRRWRLSSRSAQCCGC